MKTLISLEQYVENLEQNLIQTKKFEEAYYKIYDFMMNLKQQPQLNHFIPCVEKDGKWELIEPYIKTESEVFADENAICRAISKAESKYYSASKNVLFDGWEVETILDNEIYVYNKKMNINLIFNKITGFSIQFQSYSDLTKYNLPLTDNGEIYFNLKN